MALFKNTFSQGMDQDSSKNKYDNVHYFEAENIRIVTQNGLSSGALENVKGNFKRLTTVSGGNNYIVGHCILRDYIILWTSTNNTSTPNGASTDRIWRISIPSQMNALTETLGDNETIPADFDDPILEEIILNTARAHSGGNLLYQGNLYLCTGNKVRAVGRYESANVQKVYWVDGYNNLRHLNTVWNADTNDIDNLAVDKLEVISNITLTKPVFTGFTSGNLKAGRIQYAYQLYMLNGGESAFSPLSQLMNIASADEKAILSDAYEGSELDENTGKAVAGYVPVTSTGYNRIRIVAVQYSTLAGSPSIRIIDERAISPEGDTVYFIDSGQSLGNYTLEQLRLLGTYLFSAKEIAARDNILFQANITEKSFDINFDARAYRFAGASGVDAEHNFQTTAGLRRKCRIYNSDGYYYQGDGANPTGTWGYYDPAGVAIVPSNVTGWTNIPETFDCINRFNDPDNDGNHNYRFIYQTDGATLGGEGPHVKYTFKMKTVELDDNNGVYTLRIGTDGTVDNPSFKNYASPYMCAKYTGYARDEVYRYGIVFFDDKGRSSFVKWIADVRFPSISQTQATATYTPDNGVPTWEKDKFQTSQVHENASIEYVVTVDNDPSKRGSYVLTTQTEQAEADRRYAQLQAVSSACVNTGVMVEDEFNSGAPNPEYYVVCRFNTPGNHTPVIEMYQGEYVGGVWIRGDSVANPETYVAITQTVAYSPAGGDKYDFVPAYYNTSTLKTYMNILYPEFTVNLAGTTATGLTYQIVRVKRETTDRMIKGSGIVTGTYADTLKRYPLDFAGSVFSNDLVCFNSPEIAFNHNLNPQAGDKLKAVATLYGVTVAPPDFIESPEAGVNRTYWWKYPGLTALANPQKAITAPPVSGDEHYQYNATIVTDGKVVSMDTVETLIGPYNYFRDVSDNGTPLGCDKGINLAAIVASGSFIALDKAFNARHLVQYRRNVFNYQYGGPTYEARTRNTYMPVGPVQKQDNAVISVFEGDTFIGMFDYLNAGWGVGAAAGASRSEVVMFPVESSINLDLRMDDCFHVVKSDSKAYQIRERAGIYTSDAVTYVQHTDLYRYNTVYSKENDTKMYITRPFDWTATTSFDNRILASQVKTNNELSDSWLNFGANSYIDVDSQFGEVHALINMNSQMLFFQTRGWGSLSINERALVQTQNAAQLRLGTSGVLERFDYAKTDMGISHRDHILLSPNGLYFIDVINKAMFRYTSGVEELSLMKGMQSWFRNKFSEELTNSTIMLYYDPQYKEVNLVDTTYQFNLTYNEITDSFISFYKFYPKYVINYNDRVLSTSDKLNFYRHNDNWATRCKFYGGAVSPSTITLIINPEGGQVCGFSNLEWLTEVSLYGNTANESFTSLRISNDYQDTGSVNLVVGNNLKRRLRTWRHTIGRAKLDELGSALARGDARIRDSYMRLKLSYNNAFGRKLVVHDIITSYTESNK